jgi:hypothetical protein
VTNENARPEPGAAVNREFASEFSACGRQVVYDALAAIRRRPYKPSTGLRASGFRKGYAAALRWSQREFDEHLDEIGRARLGAVVARSEAS